MEQLSTFKKIVLATNVINIFVGVMHIITGYCISQLPNPTNAYTEYDPQAKFYYAIAIITMLIAISNIVQAFVKLPKSKMLIATHANVLLNHLLCGVSFAALGLSAIFLTYFDNAFSTWSRFPN